MAISSLCIFRIISAKTCLNNTVYSYHDSVSCSCILCHKNIYAQDWYIWNLSWVGERRPQTNGHFQVKDLFDLLCAYSHRPVTDDVFTNCRNGRKALRITSWNLHAMTLEKVENPGVREVFCRTLLENR